jgi:hypothetical protein
VSDKVYSLARAIRSVLNRAVLSGVELEEHLRIKAFYDQAPTIAGLRVRGIGEMASVPFSAFQNRIAALF